MATYVSGEITSKKGPANVGAWSVFGLLIAIGVLLRVALYFPLAMFPIDSDGVLAGLCAYKIMAGHLPLFFPGGARLSAASCYVAAAFFRALGPGRSGLALTGLVWGALFLLFMGLFVRAALGGKSGIIAILFAVAPSAAFMVVTYIPWAYGEIMVSCAATLWLACLWQSQDRPWQRLCLGISLGFGLWISLQTLMVGVPALLWILLQGRKGTLRESALVVVGICVGAIPLLIGNLGHGFPTLTKNWAAYPAANVAQIGENFVWLVRSPLPQLLFNGISSWWSLSTPLIIGYVLTGVGFAVAISRGARDGLSPIHTRALACLVALVAVFSVLLYSCSGAGSIRGWTVRYIAPLYVVLPLYFAIGISTLWTRSRWLALATTALLLIPNLMLYSLPGTAARAALSEELNTDIAIRKRLANAHVGLVYGDYYVVYHLNFDSQGKLTGIPSNRASDYIGYSDTLPKSGVRWALLGYYPDQLAAWASCIGAGGTTSTVGNLSLFIASTPASDTAGLMTRLCRTPH